MTSPVIGIDLGTTHSCVAVYEKGKCEVFENDHGTRVTPSYVAFTEHEKIVGNEAKNHVAVDPINTVFDSKRLIGRTFHDAHVQRDMKFWPFVVCEGNGKPRITVNYQKMEKSFVAEEISAMVLMKMKEIAEEKLGETVTRAVITVPAYFTDSQRQATKDAAMIAGLHVSRLINEPTAAAIAFSLNKNDEEKLNVLVFDLGGGTFDVSVLIINNGSIDVKAVNGDTHLGGSDFDAKLVEYFLNEIRRKYKKNLRKPEYKKAVLRLRNQCEIAKKSLSGRYQATIAIDSLYDGVDFTSTITRAKFDELCDDLFRRTLIPVRNALKDANFNAKEIDEIVLVGGSTRIPKVQSLLQEFFGGKSLNKSINPDEAVACGAAIQAALLEGDKDEMISNLKLNDVTALSYGINTLGDLMSVIIPRNTPYPTKETKSFYTSEDNQKSVHIKVLQGERKLTKDNLFLGKFTLHDLPAKWAGDVELDVTIEIDANGILNVSAVETSTGVTNSILITIASERLSDFEISRMVAEAERMKEEDLKNKRCILARNELQMLAYDLRRMVDEDYFGDHYSDATRTEVRAIVEDVLYWLSQYPKAQKKSIDKKLRELQQVKRDYNLE